MIKAGTKREVYEPGQKLKLRIGFSDNAEKGLKPIRICTVVKQYNNLVHLVYDLNGKQISTSMTPWEIQHNRIVKKEV